MGDIEKLLLNLDWKAGLLFLISLVFLSSWIIQKWDVIVKAFGIKTARMLREEKQTRDIEELKTHAKKTDGNIDKIIFSIDELSGSVQKVSDQVRSLQEGIDDSERSRIKDRISQVYRYYKVKGEWTSMEKEAFDGLIASYERAGGQNSFIHSVCLPESLNWNIVDE